MTVNTECIRSFRNQAGTVQERVFKKLLYLVEDHCIRREFSDVFLTTTSLKGVDANSRDMDEACRYDGTGLYNFFVVGGEKSTF